MKSIFKSISAGSFLILSFSYPLIMYFGWSFLVSRFRFIELSLNYPVIISLGLLVSFGRTLIVGPSMVERFARTKKFDLSFEERMYCRRVTYIWCAFFLFNGILAFATATRTSLEIWALYNGLISYVLIGTLFTGEYLYRHWRFRPQGALLTRWMNRWIPIKTQI